MKRSTNADVDVDSTYANVDGDSTYADTKHLLQFDPSPWPSLRNAVSQLRCRHVVAICYEKDGVFGRITWQFVMKKRASLAEEGQKLH